MTANEVPDVRDNRRRWLSVGLRIVVLVYSVLLAVSLMWIPVWLAPPYTHNTFNFYLVLLILWPILVTAAVSITVWMRWYSILATAVMAFVFLVVVVTLTGPYPGPSIGPTGPGSECTAEHLSGTRLRYTCQSYYMGEFTFETRPGLPIMWMVEQR
jgi:hypothetical protein